MRLFVDRRESALAESGDFLRAEGAVDEAHVLGELGELLCGQCEGHRCPPRSPFKGLGLEEMAVAAVAYFLHAGAGDRREARRDTD